MAYCEETARSFHKKYQASCTAAYGYVTNAMVVISSFVATTVAIAATVTTAATISTHAIAAPCACRLLVDDRSNLSPGP